MFGFKTLSREMKTQPNIIVWQLNVLELQGGFMMEDSHLAPLSP